MSAVLKLNGRLKQEANNIYGYYLRLLIITLQENHRNMHQPKTLLILVPFLFASVFVSCNRTTGKEENNTDEATESTSTSRTKDPNIITVDDPFKNQPNVFCTVIRNLDISYYAPEKTVDDVAAYPKKCCLLDVCLDQPGSSGMVVNLGDDTEIVTADFELIKVFDSADEARAYAEKHQIQDAIFE
ncbi:MAG TPA: hypothetical protein PKC38_10450 [Chitinophagales bacterium]|nr:hypothetical protein [Chitinophagales bacterium]